MFSVSTLYTPHCKLVPGTQQHYDSTVSVHYLRVLTLQLGPVLAALGPGSLHGPGGHDDHHHPLLPHQLPRVREGAGQRALTHGATSTLQRATGLCET